MIEILGSDYKGSPIIIFMEDGKFMFSCGFWKAKLILNNSDIVKRVMGDREDD